MSLLYWSIDETQVEQPTCELILRIAGAISSANFADALGTLYEILGALKQGFLG